MYFSWLIKGILIWYCFDYCFYLRILYFFKIIEVREKII